MRGKVKWWNHEKGFGFLTKATFKDTEDRDIFVHYTRLRDGSDIELFEGELVEFDIEKNKRGEMASNVYKVVNHELTGFNAFTFFTIYDDFTNKYCCVDEYASKGHTWESDISECCLFGNFDTALEFLNSYADGHEISVHSVTFDGEKFEHEKVHLPCDVDEKG